MENARIKMEESIRMQSKQIYRIKYKIGETKMKTGLMRKEDAEKMLEYLKEKYPGAVMYIDESER